MISVQETRSWGGLHLLRPAAPGEGGGGTQIIFWRGCASRNPEMGVLRADYKHKI